VLIFKDIDVADDSDHDDDPSEFNVLNSFRDEEFMELTPEEHSICLPVKRCSHFGFYFQLTMSLRSTKSR